MSVTKIKPTGIDIAGLTTVLGSVGPKISSIVYLGDDTAADPAGGQTITLNGTGFAAGFKVAINGVLVSVVSFINSTQVTFISPAKTVGTYTLHLVNLDGGWATIIPGVEYSGVPSWTTAAGSLVSTIQSTSMSVTVAATSDSTVSYSLFSGTLPAGITLNSSTGVISGTTPAVVSNTTYNFVIRATDVQNQDTDRSFSITVNAVNVTPTIEYLVVAGGGQGGPDWNASATSGGGGGAGGVLLGTLSVSSGTYAMTVGAGGGAGTGAPQNGTNSSLNSLVTSYGGGAGGGYLLGALSGGSGGGGGGGRTGNSQNLGASAVYPGSTYISGPRQGYDGGNGTNTTTYKYNSGGGGGADSAGGTATNTNGGGTGGVGINSAITGSGTYYGGGGGGGKALAGTAGSASFGGGGAATVQGTINTGGGGGGAISTGSDVGAFGGSGIVILRYADTYDAAAATTGSPTITVAGGYRVYKFTASGSITF